MTDRSNAGASFCSGCAYLRAQVGQHGCDAVDRACSMRVAKQIKPRQFGRRHLHAARIRLVVADGGRHVHHVPPVEERQDRSSRSDFRHALIGDDLKLHDGLMRGAMQLCGLEQADIVRMSLMLHEVIDVPGRRRRAARKILRRDHYIETVSRIEDRSFLLQAFRRGEKPARRDTQCGDCFVADKEPARRQAGPSCRKRLRRPSSIMYKYTSKMGIFQHDNMQQNPHKAEICQHRTRGTLLIRRLALKMFPEKT